MKTEPIIKFNNGNPIALCNRCFIIMCEIICSEEGINCHVSEIRNDSISTPIGEIPPPYCDKCKELLTYTINE